MDELIKKEDILEYSYYDETMDYVVVLNKEKLKKIFKAQHIIFEEHYFKNQGKDNTYG